MRNTILAALKDEIIEYIKSTRSPYTSDIAEVRRGIHGHDENFIGFNKLLFDEVIEFLGCII